MGGLAANGAMFSTTANPTNSSSLFNKVGGVRGSASSLGGSSITLDSKPSGRSRLLEDFRYATFLVTLIFACAVVLLTSMVVYKF